MSSAAALARRARRKAAEVKVKCAPRADCCAQRGVRRSAAVLDGLGAAVSTTSAAARRL